MKKILYLLSAITLGGTTSLVTAIQTVTKSSPPSLVDILTTVNIGRIELNDEEHIRTSLRNLNNPIFSHPSFIEDLVFDRITWNRATAHLEQSIIVEGNRLIPRLITFTIDFTADTFTLATLIPNRNLGVINDNYSYTILTRLQEYNPEIVSSELYLEVSEVYENRAIIRNINAEWHRIGQPEIEVNFTTNNYTLNSLIHNRNLGKLRNNDEATIRTAIINANSNLQPNDIQQITNITNNSAQIYGQLAVNSGSIIILPTNRWGLSGNRWRPALSNEETIAYEQVFENNIIVHFTLGEEEANYVTIRPDENASYETIAPNDNHIYETIRPPSHTNAAAPASTQTTVEKITKQNIQDSMNSYNTALKTEKEKHLVKINEHYSNLSEQEQKEFNNKIRTIGLAATNLGISGTGLLTLSKVTNASPINGLRMSANYLKNMMSSVRTGAAIETEEAVELTPLLSTGASEGLAAAETLTAVEATTAGVTEATVIGTEATVIGTEATVSASLAFETLGLSLVIGGLIAAATGIVYWLFSSSEKPTVVKHQSYNQYNEIEKYYQFLAHDKLKISIYNKE